MVTNLLAQRVKQGKMQGLFQDCAWCAFDENNIIARGCIGDAPQDARYDLASLTKVFTATALLRLAKEQSISLDAPIADFVPEISSPRLHEITLRKLLTHTSGLQAWIPFYTDGRPFWDIMIEQLALPPVKGMVYSDLNFMLLRDILCRITGLHYPDVIAKYVSVPLDLKTLSYAPLGDVPIAPCCRDNQIEERMCRERGIRFDGFRPHDTPVIGQTNDGNAFYYFRGISGHAGLFADVDSVAGLGQFYLLNKTDPWYRQALEPQDGCEGRCIGFHTGRPFPSGCGHTGFTGTSLWIEPERGIGMVILTNRLMAAGDPAPDLMPFRTDLHLILSGGI